jgi:hypothetical protein
MTDIYDNDNHLYVFHVDIKSEKSLLKKIYNDYCDPKANCDRISPRNVGWGGLSTGEMMLALMQQAYESSFKWDYFILIGHESVPLKSLHFTERFLAKQPKGSNFVNCWEVEGYDFWGQWEDNSSRLTRIAVEDFNGSMPSVLGQSRIVPTLRFLGGEESESEEDGIGSVVRFYKSIQLAVVSNEFVQYAIYSQNTRLLLIYMSNIKNSDEMILPTLLHANKTLSAKTHCASTLHFNHWSRPGGSWHPAYLTLEHLPLLLNSSDLFARKMELELIPNDHVKLNGKKFAGYSADIYEILLKIRKLYDEKVEPIALSVGAPPSPVFNTNSKRIPSVPKPVCPDTSLGGFGSEEEGRSIFNRISSHRVSYCPHSTEARPGSLMKECPSCIDGLSWIIPDALRFLNGVAFASKFPAHLKEFMQQSPEWEVIEKAKTITSDPEGKLAIDEESYDYDIHELSKEVDVRGILLLLDEVRKVSDGLLALNFLTALDNQRDKQRNASVAAIAASVQSTSSVTVIDISDKVASDQSTSSVIAESDENNKDRTEQPEPVAELESRLKRDLIQGKVEREQGQEEEQVIADDGTVKNNNDDSVSEAPSIESRKENEILENEDPMSKYKRPKPKAIPRIKVSQDAKTNNKKKNKK